MLTPPTDEHFMKLALREAEVALAMDEVPIGAVIVCKGQVIARGHNLVERLHDFTAHAEMQAYTSASEFLGGKHLTDCTLYVTLEPCVMCAGAAFHTRISRIVYGASDPNKGYSNFESERKITHPKTVVKGGVMGEECREILVNFFAKKRK